MPSSPRTTKCTARLIAIRRRTILSRSGRPRSGSSISSRPGGYSRAGAAAAGSGSQLSQRRQRCQRTPPISRDDSASGVAHARGVGADRARGPPGRRRAAPSAGAGRSARACVRTPGAGARPWPCAEERYEAARCAGGGARELERLGDQLVGAPAGLVVVGDRDDDDLVGAVGVGDLASPARDGVGRADDRAPARAAAPSSGWPSDSRKRTALSGGGTGISCPRRSSVKVIRALAASRCASSSVSAQIAHDADGHARAPGARLGVHEVRAVARGDLPRRRG